MEKIKTPFSGIEKLEEEMDDAEIEELMKNECKKEIRPATRTFGFDPQFVNSFLYEARRRGLNEQDMAIMLAPKPKFWEKVSGFFWPALPYLGFGAATGTAGYFMGKNTQVPVFEVIATPELPEMFGE